ncbi:MAG: hypothetical protein IPO27_17410 [Bacteroidetes bacterium]|nr:hypothetical protein [Bacteroidota bacterium]
MNKEYKQWIRRFYYSFPIQLVVVQVKKNHFQLFYWLLLFSIVTEIFMQRNGVPFLFFAPEYKGQVSYLSFFITGFAFGLFVIAYHISSYLLNSHRFPFLASISRTFYKYSLNNFIIPISFISLYIARTFHFQFYEEMRTLTEILLLIVSFVVGFMIILFFAFWYFSITDKSIFKLYGITPSEEEDELTPVAQLFTRKKILEQLRRKKYLVHVDVYLASINKLKLVRDTSHYDKDKLREVLRKNHYNAATFQIAVFVLFFSLGLMRDFEIFQIPAAASVFLLFTLLIMLSGLVSFWVGSWVTTAVIGILLLLNFLSGMEFINQPNRLYGINYDKPAINYNVATMDSLCNKETISNDTEHTLTILNNWKAKFTPPIDSVKPKLVLLNLSGGGVRSMVFSFKTMQLIDSVLAGKLMNQTFMINGSSGGMISGAYYRELYRTNKSTDTSTLPYAKNYDNVGKDLLNAPMFSLIVNDMFFTFQQFSDEGNYYRKDRAYYWEKLVNKNFDQILQGRLKDYQAEEAKAAIPMLLLSPTIINDGRFLLISPQPCSYLLHQGDAIGSNTPMVSNGVEFSRLMQNHDALNMRLTSALRINSSFPYIMPPGTLPTSPRLECMDSGMRDNFGLNMSMRFVYIFREWINENTSGVVMIQIRDTNKKNETVDNTSKTFVQSVFAPIRSISMNMIPLQDYANDGNLEMLNTILDNKITSVTFQLPDTVSRVPLSWHLTNREKLYIAEQAYNAQNTMALQYLERLLK